MPRFPPEHEVLQRLRWDPRFHGLRLWVGVATRRDGVVEQPFQQFDPEHGDVPLHRVAWVRSSQGWLWHRELRLDRVFGTHPEPLGPLPPLPGGDPAPPPEAKATELSLVAFNLHGDREAAQELRAEALAQALRERPEDLLALVEVGPRVRELLQGPHLAFGGGQALVSRWPIQAAHDLTPPDSPRSRVLWCEVRTPAGLLPVVTVHFTSNRTPGAAARRLREWNWLHERLAREPAWLVAGDFNADDAEFAGWTLDARDAWTERHPDAPGATHDARGERPRRLDRILAGPTRSWEVLDCGLWDPDLSDHLAVHARLRWKRSRFERALAIVPGREHWPAVQRVREQFDPAFERWPPHLNLLYPYEPQPGDAEAVARGAPFQATLDRLGTFPQGLHWLGPDPATRRSLDALRGNLREGDWTPHLTLGRDSQGWQPLQFPVHALYVLRRNSRRAMEVEQVFPLRGAPPPAVHRVEELCRAVLPPGTPVRVWAYGSSLLGEGRDVDLVCVGHPDVTEEQFGRDLEALTDGHYAAGPRLPLFRWGEVELCYARPPAGQGPAQDARTTCRQWGETPRALEGACDWERLLEWADERFLPSALRTLFHEVVAWAHREEVYGPRLGYLGGFSWALLSALHLEEGEPDLAAFRRRWAEWPWPRPVALEPGQAGPAGPMPILTPTRGVNAAYHVTEGSARWILRALAGRPRPRPTRVLRFTSDRPAPEVESGLAAAWSRIEADLGFPVRVRPSRGNTWEVELFGDPTGAPWSAWAAQKGLT